MKILKMDNKIFVELPSIDVIDIFQLPNEKTKIKPGTSGVYFILNENQEVIYIGKSKDIRNRLSGHLNGQDSGFFKQRPQINKDEISFCKVLVLEEKYLELAEQIYISIYQPNRNFFQYWKELEEAQPSEFDNPELLRSLVESDDD